MSSTRLARSGMVETPATRIAIETVSNIVAQQDDKLDVILSFFSASDLAIYEPLLGE